MSKKISLHEFQSYLAARLAGTSNQSSAGLLGVQAGPADKILAGELKKLKLLAQARDNATAQFKADFVNQLVTHAANLTRQLAGVNAATIHLLKGTSRVQRT